MAGIAVAMLGIPREKKRVGSLKICRNKLGQELNSTQNNNAL